MERILVSKDPAAVQKLLKEGFKIALNLKKDGHDLSYHIVSCGDLIECTQFTSFMNDELRLGGLIFPFEHINHLFSPIRNKKYSVESICVYPRDWETYYPGGWAPEKLENIKCCVAEILKSTSTTNISYEKVDLGRRHTESKDEMKELAKFIKSNKDP